MLAVWRSAPITFFLAVLVPCVAFAATAASQTSEPEDLAEAYYQFLLGRHFDGQDETDKAIDAYRTAVRLDPAAADVLVDLAELFARRGRSNEAIEAAQAALVIDEDHREAHRMLGLVLVALAERAGQRGGPTTSESQRQYASDAISHLERADQADDPRLQVTLARLYLNTGAGEQAIALLSRVLENEPDYREAMLLLSRAYTESGDPTKAITALERIVQGQPRFYRGLLTLAELYEGERRWADAALAYEKAVTLNPNNVDVRRRWASALASAGDTERAAGMLREIVAAQPGDAESLFLLANVERRAGRLEAAEQAARQLIALDGEDLRGSLALLRVFRGRGDHQQAAATLDQAIALARGSNRPPSQVASLLAELSGEYRALGDGEGAVAALEEAGELVPGDRRVLELLVQAYVEEGRVSDALSASGLALEQRPNDVMLSRLYAETLVRDGRAGEALSVLEPVARESGDPRGYMALAELYGSIQRFDDALQVLQEARAKFPENTVLMFQLGASLERQELYKEAERVFRDLIERDPSHAAALNYLGYLMADRGERLEESVGFIRRALEIEPDNAAFLDSLGWAYFKLDRLDLAESPLRRASEMLQLNSVVQDHFGDLLERLGRYSDAIATWERALTGDGESIEPEVIKRKIHDARQRVPQE